VCCIVLQCVAVCVRFCAYQNSLWRRLLRSGGLQCVAVWYAALYCSVLQCSMLQWLDDSAPFSASCLAGCFCCSALQSVAIWCNVVCCSVLQCVAVCCSVLQCVAVNDRFGASISVVVQIDLCYSVLQSGAICCSVACCSVLQCV